MLMARDWSPSNSERQHSFRLDSEACLDVNMHLQGPLTHLRKSWKGVLKGEDSGLGCPITLLLCSTGGAGMSAA